MAGRLVPALAASHPDTAAPPLDSPVAVTRLYAAIADTLQATAGGGDEPGGAGTAREARAAREAGTAREAGAGGIVVVEDVHWADSSSLGLLAYLVRRLADWPLLLVLSWQPEQAGRLRVLRTALGEAENQSLGQTVEPGPLGPEAIGTLLRLDGMPRIDVSRLLAETRGLPMLVREYVEALRAAGEPETGAGEPGAWWPPASVRDLLRTRLQAVSEAARQMLTAAAVLGSANDADLLRAVSGRGEDEIVEAIDDALARSLLTEIPPPGPQQAPSYETAAALAIEADRATQAAIEHKLADVHHRLGDWDLAEAHLAVVSELARGPNQAAWPGLRRTAPWSPTGAAPPGRQPSSARPRWPAPRPPPIPAPPPRP
jgi:hypothetical protein